MSLRYSWRGRKTPDRASPNKPISRKASRWTGARIAVVVFGGFLLMGSVLTVFLFVLPVLRVHQAKAWNQTPCVVVSSTVGSHSGDDGTTYSVDIVYAYTVGGREYRSDRYDFMGGSSSGYEGKARIVAQYPPGKKAVCYVNPADPADAVLNREFTSTYLLGLIPAAFALIGLVGLVFFVPRALRAAAAAPAVAWMPKAEAVAGPTRLRPSVSPLKKLVAALAFTLFWNGIVSVFVWQVIKGWQSGSPDWFLTLFMVPFVLVGLGGVGVIVYFALALLNPRPVLTVTATAVPLGGTIGLQWAMIGRVDAIARLSIFLEGREEATYRRGTTTVTDRQAFATIPVADASDRYEILAGEAQIAVPPDTMHSFAAPNNKIVWTLKVHADVRRWPDVKEDYPIIVLPETAAQEG